MVEFKNDAKRLIDEYDSLKIKNSELYNIILDLDKYIAKTFNKPLIITMIYRTQEEQDEIYKEDEQYQKKPVKSPHQFNDAIDIRSSLYNHGQIASIENYLNSKFNRLNYYHWTAKCHIVPGNAWHFHIQFHKK